MQNAKIKFLKFNEFGFERYPLLKVKKEAIKDLPDVLKNTILKTLLFNKNRFIFKLKALYIYF